MDGGTVIARGLQMQGGGLLTRCETEGVERVRQMCIDARRM